MGSFSPMYTCHGYTLDVVESQYSKSQVRLTYFEEGWIVLQSATTTCEGRHNAHTVHKCECKSVDGYLVGRN